MYKDISKKEIFNWKNVDFIEKLVFSLKNNEISICTTDTVLGFIANLSQKSFLNLNYVKGGREEKPYIILISSIDKLSNFVQMNLLNKKILNFIKKIWPGPITIIFKAKDDLPDFLISKDKKIALRIPDHKGLNSLLKNFNGLFSTSANKSGEKVPDNFNDIDLDILNKISYLVTDFIDIKEILNQTLPSTIIDVSDNENIKLVREGFVSITQLESLYGSKFIK